MAVVIFKPTENCNSNCIYCDVALLKRVRETMSPELLELIFIKINEYLVRKPEEKITLIWHGGEPLLLGVDYFKKALEFQRLHCKETKSRVEHAIQSNLTLVNREFLEIFRELGINTIGTSFEPCPHVRGPGENVDSDSYNRDFMTGISLLKENNIGWGFIYVVNKFSLANPLGIFYYLTNLNLRGGFLLNQVLVYGEDKSNIKINAREYADFLGTIFPVWWKRRDRYPDVEPFQSYVKNTEGGSISLGCTDSGSCTYNHVYIGPTGETSQCGRSADWGIIFYGNIKDFSFEEILNDPKRQTLQKRVEVLPETDCKGCRFWHRCHGGCPLDAYAKFGDFMHKSDWCAAKKLFIEKYFEPITGLKYNHPEIISG